MSCRNPVDFDTLAGYWLGELPEEREAALEEHFFGCPQCTKRLEELAALAYGVRAAVVDGKVSMVVSAPFVEAMQNSGLRLRQYELEPGGSVNCTIRADDSAVVSRLRAPLSGVKRLDLTGQVVGETSEVRLADIPFDAASGEVLVVPSPAWLKSMPAFTMRMRLIAMDDAEEKEIGEYTFNHSPS